MTTVIAPPIEMFDEQAVNYYLDTIDKSTIFYWGEFGKNSKVCPIIQELREVFQDANVEKQLIEKYCDLCLKAKYLSLYIFLRDQTLHVHRVLER